MQAPHTRDSSRDSDRLHREEFGSREMKESRESVCKQRRRARFTQQPRDGNQSAAPPLGSTPPTSPVCQLELFFTPDICRLSILPLN